MKAQKLARLGYRALIRLHPRAFRRRFVDEMLWIFDRSAGRGQTAFLLYDGARSAVLQQARLDLQEEAASGFCLEVRTSGLTLARVSQAAVLGGVLLSVLSLAVAREMPPVPVFDPMPTCQPSLEIPPPPASGTRQ